MSTDVGPFQQIIGFGVPLEDQWDQLIDNESLSIRYSGCREDTELSSSEYDLDGPIRVAFGAAGFNFCYCDAGQSTLQYDVYNFNIPHDPLDPPEIPWWDCVIGEESGARIWNAWVPAPEGWPEAPQPTSFDFSNCKAVGGLYTRQGRIVGAQTWTISFARVTSCTGVCCV